MTDRLEPLLPTELSEAQREQYESIVQYVGDKYDGVFQTRDEEGRLLGPFGILLHTPGVAEAYIPMIKAIAKITNLPDDLRETVILVVGSRTGAKYETYAHDAVSGFTREECQSILDGECPTSFDPKRRLAYRLASALAVQKGPLSADLWAECTKSFGREQTTALVHYIGFYSYIAVLLNGFDASIPEETFRGDTVPIRYRGRPA